MRLSCFCNRQHVFFTGFVFLLKRGQYLHFYFGLTTLCYCSLNGEYSESEHLSKSVTAKIICFSLEICYDNSLFLGQILQLLFTCACTSFPSSPMPPNQCFLCSFCRLCSCSSLTKPVSKSYAQQRCLAMRQPLDCCLKHGG